MEILCFFGMHNWVLKRLAEWPMGYVKAVLDGHVCCRCGKRRHTLDKLTEGLPQDYTIIWRGKWE
jgi:hypothetical protein